MKTSISRIEDHDNCNRLRRLSQGRALGRVGAVHLILWNCRLNVLRTRLDVRKLTASEGIKEFESMREYHIFDGSSTIIAERAPHEDFWRIKIDWRREVRNASGLLISLSSAPCLDNRFEKEKFETADAAIAAFLYRLACGWFNRQIERLGRVMPGEAGMYQSALDHFRQAQPKTVKEAKTRVGSMPRSLAIWGQSMFPLEQTSARLEALLGV
jgi:hypothetical protein